MSRLETLGKGLIGNQEAQQRYFASLAEQADALRNPNTGRLLEIGRQYCAALELAAPGCKTDIGGSLISDTCLPGHQDIDLKLLVPAGCDNEEGIRGISAQIQGVVPFQKVRPYGGDEADSIYALIHQKLIDDPQAGSAELEVLVVPERVYVGYAKFQSQLPQWMLDSYVIAKAEALKTGDKRAYKDVKNGLYSMTRALYRDGHFT